MAEWKRGTRIASVLAAAVVAAAPGMPDVYSSSHFALELDGSPAGLLKSIEGGSVKAEVVTYQTGNKQVAGSAAIGEVVFSFEPPVAAPLKGWIDDALRGVSSPRDAASVLYSADGRRLSVDEFYGALITEIGFPALDGDSKDAAGMRLRFKPSATRHKAGSGERVKSAAVPKQKLWTASAFRVSLAGLPTKNVVRVEPFLVRIPPKPPVPTDNPNGDPVAPPPVEVGNLKWTILGPDVEAWAAWFEDFVVRGNHADSLEKDGAIELLDDAGAVILTVKLSHVGIFGLSRLAPVKGKGGDPLEVLEVDLYVEAMRLE